MGVILAPSPSAAWAEPRKDGRALPRDFTLPLFLETWLPEWRPPAAPYTSVVLWATSHSVALADTKGHQLKYYLQSS